MVDSIKLDKTESNKQISLIVKEQPLTYLIKAILKILNDECDVNVDQIFTQKDNVKWNSFKEKYSLIQGMKYALTLTKEYIDNENSILRSKYNEDNNDNSSSNQIMKAVNEFNLIEDSFSQAIFYEITNKKFSLITTLPIQSLEGIMNLYLMLFLNNNSNLGSSQEEAKDLLSRLIQLRYNPKSCISHKELCRNILWIESHIECIKTIIDICSLLSSYKANVIANISNNNQKQSLELFYNCPNYKQCFLKPIYIPLQALIQTSLSINTIIEELPQIEFDNYINTLKAIDDKYNIIEFSLGFQSFELTLLHNFIEVVNCMKSSNTYAKANIIQYLSIINKDINRELLDDKNELTNSLFNEYTLLSSLIGSNGQYPKIMTNILINKFNTFKEKIYHKEIVEVIVKSQGVLLQSSKLLHLLFNKHMIYSSMSSTDIIISVFKSLSTTKEITLEPFEKSNEDIKMILFAFFKQKMQLFFFEQMSIHDKLFDNSLQMFQYSLQLIEDIINNKANCSLPSLSKLYYLSYINIYLQNYVFINHSQNAQIGDCSELNTIILGDSNSHFRQTIKKYILRLFKTHFASISEMKKFDWEIHQIDWINQYEINEELFQANNNDSFEKYFTIDKCMQGNELQIQVNAISNGAELYPVLTNYLQCRDRPEYKALTHISSINPFVNYMIDTYSNNKNIERDIATRFKLSNMMEDNSSIKQLYYQFQSGLSILLNDNAILLSENNGISSFFNDSNSLGQGKWLYETYRKYIKVQNTFLNNVMHSKSKALLLLSTSINQPIIIQHATTDDLLTFNITFLNSNYHSFDDLMSTYLNQTQQYDLESIENELELVLLKGKHIFSEQQKTIKYAYENMISISQFPINLNYILKYPQNETPFDSQVLLSYLNNVFGPPNFLMSFTRIIPLILIENYPQGTSIKDIIDLSSTRITSGLPQNVKRFIDKSPSLNVNNILNVYQMIEGFCHGFIQDNSPIEIVLELSKEKKELINSIFNKELIGSIITKKSLAVTIMKLISKGNQFNNKNTINLFEFINKREYWTSKEWDSNKISNELNILKSKIVIEVSEALALYYHLIKVEKSTIKESNSSKDGKPLKKRFLY